ncbi:hypothetical protein [Glaciibacter flavus]|uniref:hypothetical protein n=1 Tax=Orlajensenia flava TaxID=2565934 RepID=UPI003AFF9BB6
MPRTLLSTAAALAAVVALMVGSAAPAFAEDGTPPPSVPVEDPSPPADPPPLLPDKSDAPISTPPETPVIGDFSDPPFDNLGSAPAPVVYPPVTYVTQAELQAEGSRRSSQGFAWLRDATAAYTAAGMSFADAETAALADLNAITMRPDFDLHPYLPAFRMRGPGEAASAMPSTTLSRGTIESAGVSIEVPVAATIALRLHNLAGKPAVVTLGQDGEEVVSRAVGPNRAALVRVHLDAGADVTLSIAGASDIDSGVTARFVPLPVDGWEHALTER